MTSSFIVDVQRAIPSFASFYLILAVLKNPTYMGEDISSYVLVAALTMEKLAGVLALSQTMEAGRASGSTGAAIQVHAWSFLLANTLREIALTDFVQDSLILNRIWSIVPIILLLIVTGIALIPQRFGFFAQVLKGSSLSIMNVLMDSLAFSALGESWTTSMNDTTVSWDSAKKQAPYMLMLVLAILIMTGKAKNIFKTDEVSVSSFDQKWTFVSLQVASWIIQACALAYGKARFNGLPSHLTPLSNGYYQMLLIGSTVVSCIGMKVVYKRVKSLLDDSYGEINIALGMAYGVLCGSTILSLFSPVIAAGSTQKALDLLLDAIGGDVLPILSPVQGFISSALLYQVRADAGITACRAAYKEALNTYGRSIANNQATCFEAVEVVSSYMQIIPGITIGLFMYYMVFWGRDTWRVTNWFEKTIKTN